MIDTCILVRGGVASGEPVPLDQAFESAGTDDCWVWIRVTGATPEDFVALRAELDLHPLAVEDALHRHQRPKLEIYGDSMFAVAKEARVGPGTGIAFEELHLFVGPHVLVTIETGERQHGVVGPVDRALIAASRDANVASHGPCAGLYFVLDACVDGYQPVLDLLEESIDGIESEVFSETRSNAAERIYRLKQQAMELRRAAQPLLESVAPASRGRLPIGFMAPELSPFFRDLEEHLVRTNTRVDDCRELLSSALDVNLAKIGVRQNEDMRRMSAWAAIIAVPTMMAGVWGMNFEHMPELRPEFGYPAAVGGMVTASGLLYRRFRKAGWL